MLLTITYSGHNTSELGYLLHKNPNRSQKFELNYGAAYVFYPCVSDERTQVALLLDINPIDLARGKSGTSEGGLFAYVNDRPYVSSSFMSVAVSRVFRTAMLGTAGDHQALSDSPIELEAGITMLPCKSDPVMINRVFEPLGYEVSYRIFDNDEKFPAWGKSNYVNLTIKGRIRLRDLLRHIYVLIPVFDLQKHYWINQDEVEKLMRNAEDWLPNHPEKRYIASRYLKQLRPLVNNALAQLIPEDFDANGEFSGDKTQIEVPEQKASLNDERLDSVVNMLKTHNAKSVIDLGCGEGNLLRLLVKDKQFTRIAGADVSWSTLKRANERLKLEDAGEYLQSRLKLFPGSLNYKDSRFIGYDAACVIEVVEHFDLPRLSVFEQILFEYTKPHTVILTTPNKEYNIKYKNITEAGLRHPDHRFEWTRGEFHKWAGRIAEKYGYKVDFFEIGELDEILGASTQMGVFEYANRDS